MNKVVRVAGGERPEAWAAALGEAGWVERAAVLKEDGGSWVRRGTLLGRDVVVKCRVLNTLGRRVKAAIGMGHGAKHWRGAERLMRAGIATGKPLMLVRVDVDGVGCEVLVLEFVVGRTLLEVLDAIAHGRGPRVRDQHAIARMVGSTVKLFLKGGLQNEDSKPSNLIVTRVGDGCFGIVVIDCVAIRKYGHMNLLDIETYDMLESLMIEPIGCRCPPRRALWMRALNSLVNKPGAAARSVRRVDLGTLVMEIEFGVTQHGDPRPRVDPLAGTDSRWARK